MFVKSFLIFILFALLRALSTEVAFKFSMFLLCVYIIFTRFLLCLSLSSSILYLTMSTSWSCLSSGFIQYTFNNLRRAFFLVCLTFVLYLFVILGGWNMSKIEVKGYFAFKAIMPLCTSVILPNINFRRLTVTKLLDIQ